MGFTVRGLGIAFSRLYHCRGLGGTEGQSAVSEGIQSKPASAGTLPFHSPEGRVTFEYMKETSQLKGFSFSELQICLELASGSSAGRLRVPASHHREGPVDRPLRCLRLESPCVA